MDDAEPQSSPSSPEQPATPRRLRVVAVGASEGGPEATQATPADPRGAASEATDPLFASRREELASTRTYLQSVIEQLTASNKQVVSANEELRRTNEELHAANQEITIVNEELSRRIAEVTRLNDDLAQAQGDSQRRGAERRILQYQAKLREMAFDAAVVGERERRRIAADLHDRIGQSLALAQMKLTAVRAEAGGEVRDALDGSVQLLQQTIADTRSLVFDLSPPILYDLGLQPALSWLAEDIEQRHGVHVELAGERGPLGLDTDVAALLFRSVRELLLNVVKHARTTSAAVTIQREGGAIRIDVRDFGAGFDPSKDSPLSRGAGFGLFSVREQMAVLGGSMEIEAALGTGTHVTLRVPATRSAPSSEEWP